MGAFNLWKMLAGVAIFLLGMNFLEDGIKALSGRRFKLFLKEHTAHKVMAIVVGALITGLLQGSSIVNLMVLGFVGAGVIGMENALAIILGANLGSTFDTWAVATLGFKVNMEAYSLPVLGIAGIAMALLQKNSKAYNWSMFLLGLSLLFTGLEYMKASTLAAIQTFDLAQLNDYPLILFLLAGLVITALIQSSFATAAIVLSALNAGILDLYSGTAIVLGAEAGTTIKLLIASVGNSPVKKRVATGNFLFNVITILLLFFFIRQVDDLITNTIGIKDKLIALASFQTLVNLVSIVLFYPLLPAFGKFLDRRFTDNHYMTAYIHTVSPDDFDAAEPALEKETRRFIKLVIGFCRKIFDGGEEAGNEQEEKFAAQAIQEQYEYLKHLHGDIYAYYISLGDVQLQPEESKKLDNIISSVRNGMYAAKSIKDAIHDIEQLRNSSHDEKYNIYQSNRKECLEFCNKIAAILNDSKTNNFEELVAIYKSIQDAYEHSMNFLYKEASFANLSEVEVSTIINFNREMFSYYKSIIFSVKNLLLTPEQLDYFDELPGFIN
ncbi:MAG: Na/Pi cotransporter family protein [Bacteroidetes bacterium]|nr:Na/Pi cotransporter family protein [Bacteroidota bacterium]